VGNIPRRPWVAALLTLFSTGLGHLYVGEAKRGIILFTINQFVYFAVVVSSLLVTPNFFFFAIFIALSVWIFCIIDATLIAKKKKGAYQPKSYNNWYMPVAYFIVFSLLISPLVSRVIRTDFVEAFRIPSGAMVPTLAVGDHLLVDKFIYGPRIPFMDSRIFMGKVPKRGEVIVFKYPEDESRNFIKRVIGLPGDKIEIKHGTLFINEQPVPVTEIGSHVEQRQIGDQTHDVKTKLMEEQFGTVKHGIQYLHDQSGYNFGPVQVPNESVFVMGDNRDNSQDSRFWGFVKFNKILGKALFIYWSWDSVYQNVRWDRIGKSIQ